MNLKKSILSGSIAALALAASASAAFIEVGTNGAGGNTISVDTRWTRDNVYILRRVVYVVPPAKLVIEPGTIIRGVREGSGFDTTDANEPGCLAISRGAKIIANGTPDDPIIFTSVDDPHVIGGTATIPATVNGNPVTQQNYAPDGPTNTNGFAFDSQWGGLIILGEGPIGYDGVTGTGVLTYTAGTNTYSGDTLKYPSGAAAEWPVAADIKGGDGVGVALIEGLNIATVSGVTYSEPFPGATGAPTTGSIIPGVYGGLNRADSSGSLQFVSSRYGGFTLAANAEINGMTFGGVGSGTVAEWLEVYNNSDDSFEFFGGYVNPRYLFSLFHDDDGFDGDQGFNGNFQFCFDIADNLNGTRAGYPSNNTATGRLTDGDAIDKSAEWDGSEGAAQNGSVTPNTGEQFYNFTFMPSPIGGDDGITHRRGVSGTWRNGLYQNISDIANVEAADTGVNSFDFLVYSNVTNAVGKLGATQYNSPGTALVSEVVGAARLTKNGLDPRAASGATSADPTKFNKPVARAGDYPYSGHTQVPLGGCMRDNLMLSGWSILDYLDLLATTNTARPALTLGVSGSNPTVSFAAGTGVGGRAVLYSVERSADRRVWTPFAVVSDANAAGTVDFSGATFATTDGNAAAGAITVTDAATTLTAGTPVYYRVIPR